MPSQFIIHCLEHVVHTNTGIQQRKRMAELARELKTKRVIERKNFHSVSSQFITHCSEITLLTNTLIKERERKRERENIYIVR